MRVPEIASFGQREMTGQLFRHVVSIRVDQKYLIFAQSAFDRIELAVKIFKSTMIDDRCVGGGCRPFRKINMSFAYYFVSAAYL